MDHSQLTGTGRITHREIDAQLPTDQEKQTLHNIAANAELELLVTGNSAFDQDGNWRLRIDGNGDLVIEARVGGTWTAQATLTT